MVILFLLLFQMFYYIHLLYKHNSMKHLLQMVFLYFLYQFFYNLYLVLNLLYHSYYYKNEYSRFFHHQFFHKLKHVVPHELKNLLLFHIQSLQILFLPISIYLIKYTLIFVLYKYRLHG